MLEALALVRTGAVTGAARDDAEAPARFHRGDAVGFIDERLVAWGEPAETLEAVLGELGREAELVTLIAGDGAPLEPEDGRRARPDGRRARVLLGRPARLLVADRRRVAPPSLTACRPRVRLVRTPSLSEELTRGRRPARCRGRRGSTRRSRSRPRRPPRAPSGSGCRRSATCSSTSRATAREARTIAELAPDEVATVVVEVRSITSRPVRRRGMKPLVEATVADADRRA